MNTATTKAERNARVLDGFILAGEAECALLMAEAREKRAEDPKEAARLLAQWGRVSRRTMQAMVLDDKLDRLAAEDRRQAEDRAKPAPDPQVAQRRADILAEFRIDGLDHDMEIELKHLLGEMDDDELLGYPLLENLGRISRHLNWEPADAVTEAADPPPSGEVARSDGGGPPGRPQQHPAQTPQMTPSVTSGDSSPKGGAPGPRLVAPPEPAPQGEQGPAEPERSALWRRQMARIAWERAHREPDGPDEDTS